MKEIELDLFELQSAAHLGILRCLESIKHKEKWGYNYKGSLMQKFSHSISGACAEAAVAKYLNIKFPYTCNHGNQPDLIYKDKKQNINPVLISTYSFASKVNINLKRHHNQ